ncbi:MAG: phosphomannomutase/phosphoglucomutase [Candidatus Komeilibacteria bacterium CG11_big_fil_rev_8_21_14_0_20_36_20]|uniref:Phosphomannomutase/phosphoglucomutase n=1 Tax=Candidatus Komeilibacteria bacterium CG11_big_fil_rev_8_21_14_0_20_36_20 TaxID=1974477 RepID=A0A2H0NB73_9BACT|nr:MAG: phosphomannomutase/phosphoglucomutase [Candidatus Komeilibacteria bacterium CG11_big_fil_rev_8_21_14_0_20_36_20]PIR81856.1 MAG: phosphomannomutase/phosphoglucomutase [Candidatus Komeilibacteria bacterium CG10_big_fil_rev_8_21_14_0_10_36_65]PJC55064.1 MAG: phosphomannomutase/phosphoglucomutase [Candidatus Komeilibacteria bacterium CG_4_9_14_0_2_um_filter_36_13]
MESKIFKAYDIRGIYPIELNEETARLIAQTFLKILSQQLNKPIKDLKISICRDARQSSEPLMNVVRETFLEYGVAVDDFNLISINDFYFSVGYYKYDGGIMATASHNPSEYGGFKMVMLNPEDKASIEFISGQELYVELTKLNFPLNDQKVEGKLQKKDLKKDYLKNLLSSADIKKIKPLKVVVDTGNGMMGLLIPELFKNLPCELIHLFPELDSNFPNRPPNPLEPGASNKLAQKVLEEKADLGVIFDVDGDRMFLVDEKGNFLRGDMVLLLLAKSMLHLHPGAGIAYNLICSHAVKDLVAKWGGRPIRSEVGYLNLARHMREQGGVMSGEVSGHFAFKDNYYADSGFIALLLALQAISMDGRKLSEMIKDFTLYSRADELNIQVQDINAELDKIKNKYRDNILDEIDGITVEFPDWWFNVRPSNTEPLLRITVEANSAVEVKKHQQEIMDIINS